MGVGHRYSLNHRGSQRKHSSRASRKVVMQQSTSAGHEALIPGKKYLPSRTRETDGTTEVKVYRAVQSEDGTWCKGELLRVEGADAERQEPTYSVIKSKEQAVAIVLDTLPELQGIMVATLLEEQGHLDAWIGRPRLDFKAIVRMIGERVTLEGANELGQPLSLDMLAENGFDIDESVKDPSFWSIPAWERVIDSVSDGTGRLRATIRRNAWEALTYLHDGQQSEGRTQVLSRIWEIGPSILGEERMAILPSKRRGK